MGKNDPYNAAVDEIAQIGVSQIHVGVPAPNPQRQSSFMMQLRKTLGRMQVQDSIELKNVSRAKEKQIRVRIAENGRKLKRQFCVRAEKRPKGDTDPRTLRVWRIN